MLPPDNHVHSQWSWDAPAAASMTGGCEQALAAGVPALAFTDHLDFTVPAVGDQIAAQNIEPRPYAWMRSLDVDGGAGRPSAGGRVRAAADCSQVQVSPKRAVMSSQLSSSGRRSPRFVSWLSRAARG